MVRPVTSTGVPASMVTRYPLAPVTAVQFKLTAPVVVFTVAANPVGTAGTGGAVRSTGVVAAGEAADKPNWVATASTVTVYSFSTGICDIVGLNVVPVTGNTVVLVPLLTLTT